MKIELSKGLYWSLTTDGIMLSKDDDKLIKSLIISSEQLCMDVARISDKELFEKQPCSKVAVLYAVAYFYEHREDANHLELTLSIRALLSGIRQEGF